MAGAVDAVLGSASASLVEEEEDEDEEEEDASCTRASASAVVIRKSPITWRDALVSSLSIAIELRNWLLQCKPHFLSRFSDIDVIA
jgi:hypothetical protein